MYAIKHQWLNIAIDDVFFFTSGAVSFGAVLVTNGALLPWRCNMVVNGNDKMEENA